MPCQPGMIPMQTFLCTMAPTLCEAMYGPCEVQSLGNNNRTQTFFLKFFGQKNPRVRKIFCPQFWSRKWLSVRNPGISCQKVWFSWFRGTYRTFWPPPHSCGRPPLHRKISAPKSLGLCSFFFPESWELGAILTELNSNARPTETGTVKGDCKEIWGESTYSQSCALKFAEVQVNSWV